MDVKGLLVMAGIVIFTVLAAVPIAGLPKLPVRTRIVRAVFVMVAMAFILVGAHWR